MQSLLIKIKKKKSHFPAPFSPVPALKNLSPLSRALNPSLAKPSLSISLDRASTLFRVLSPSLARRRFSCRHRSPSPPSPSPSQASHQSPSPFASLYTSLAVAGFLPRCVVAALLGAPQSRFVCCVSAVLGVYFASTLLVLGTICRQKAVPFNYMEWQPLFQFQSRVMSTDHQNFTCINAMLQETAYSRNNGMRNFCSLDILKLGAVGTPRSLRLHLNFPTRSSFRRIHMASGPYHEPRGALIVLEGLDRCGKTSQSCRLVSYLEGKGFSVESWRFPDRNTGVGEMISSYLSNKSQLDDRAIHLLFSANRWEKRLLMESKLKSGTTLVVDRYSYSGVAFSAAKGLDIEWCKAPEIGLLAPDLVVYLEMPPEKAAERGGYGHERYEKLDFQKKVAQHYDFLRDETWKIVDACLPMEDVEKQLQEIALEALTECQKGKPFSHLWLRK